MPRLLITCLLKGPSVLGPLTILARIVPEAAAR